MVRSEHSRIWLLAGLLVALTTDVYGQGIAARNRAETLTGLNGVHVIVEDLSEIGIQSGLTAPAIKSAVEAKLAAKGIPVLGLGELTMDPRGPTLLVKVDLDLSEPVYFYNIQVQFFQNVSLATGGDVLASSASASTWQSSEFGRIGTFRIGTLPQEIGRLVEAFAQDYLKHNEALEPAEDPAGESDEERSEEPDDVEEPDGGGESEE
jgi:hypothetical protein